VPQPPIVNPDQHDADDSKADENKPSDTSKDEHEHETD